jgi:hypothetical protein
MIRESSQVHIIVLVTSVFRWTRVVVCTVLYYPLHNSTSHGVESSWADYTLGMLCSRCAGMCTHLPIYQYTSLILSMIIWMWVGLPNLSIWKGWWTVQYISMTSWSVYYDYSKWLYTIYIPYINIWPKCKAKCSGKLYTFVNILIKALKYVCSIGLQPSQCRFKWFLLFLLFYSRLDMHSTDSASGVRGSKWEMEENAFISSVPHLFEMSLFWNSSRSSRSVCLWQMHIK